MGLSLLRGRRQKTAPCCPSCEPGQSQPQGPKPQSPSHSVAIESSGFGLVGRVAEGEMRISDVLRTPDDDDGGDDENPCSCTRSSGWRKREKKGSGKPSSSSSSIWVCSRWVVSVQKAASFLGRERGGERLMCWVPFVRVGNCREIEEEEDEEVVVRGGVSESSSSPVSAGVPMEAEEVPLHREAEEASVPNGQEMLSLQQSQGNSGNEPSAISLRLGLGVGLSFVLAKCASDFHKMAEMRREMEVIVKEFKDVMQRKYVVSDSKESKYCDLGFAGSDSGVDQDTSNAFSLQNHNSFYIVETDFSDENCRGSNETINFDNNNQPKMDNLEAELESELELLQISLEDEEHLLSGCAVEMMDDNSDMSKGSNASSEVENNIEEENQEEDTSCEYGVPPHTLERRLHELLHTRQQDRIAELESALQCAEQKLREKEMEISWWRDTAQLVSQYKHVSVSR